MPRHSPSSTALPSGAGGVGYIPGIRTDWSTPEPESVQQALDNIGSTRVSGPASATDHAIARWNGTGGDTLQDSLATISDAGHLYTPGNLQCLGILIAVGAGPHYLGPIAGATTIRIGSANEYIANDSAGTLTIAAATAVVVGNAGNTILGDGTLRELRPHTTEKISLGSLSKAFFDVCAAQLRLLERSADPTEPSEGNGVIWMSDGTGKGDDGDILIASRAGGVTKYATLFDHSAGGAW